MEARNYLGLISGSLGLVLNVSGVALPPVLMATINMLGQVAIPLMLFSLGARMLDIDLKDWRLGTFGAFAGPAVGVLSALAVIPWLQLSEIETAILLVFAALPPAVFNVLLAEQYNQQPHRVASIVILGNLASIAIIPMALWWALPNSM